VSIFCGFLSEVAMMLFLFSVVICNGKAFKGFTRVFTTRGLLKIVGTLQKVQEMLALVGIRKTFYASYLMF